MDYKHLAFLLRCEGQHHELKKALTHPSFYTMKEADQDNKYVFLGQTAFKGYVADILFDHFPLNAKQVEDYHNKIFSKKILAAVYDKYQLQNLIRHQLPDSELTHQQPFFVFGLLGFAFKHLNADFLHLFTFKHFFYNTQHLVSGNKLYKDQAAQLKYLCQLFYKQSYHTEHTIDNEGLHCFSVHIGEQLLSKAVSKSYKYANKKAIKQAIVYITNQQEAVLEQDPVFQKRMLQRQKEAAQALAKEKAEKLRLYKAKQKEKQKARAEKRARLKQEAQERDRQRRLSKQRAKERQAQRKAAKKATIDISQLSSAKRRILEDRGVIKKQKK